MSLFQEDMTLLGSLSAHHFQSLSLWPQPPTFSVPLEGFDWLAVSTPGDSGGGTNRVSLSHLICIMIEQPEFHGWAGVVL